MTLARRSVLLAFLLAPARLQAAPARARLRPDLASAIGFAPLPRERVAFRATGLPGGVILPVARAAIRAVLPLAGREVALLSFAADPSPGPLPQGQLDLAAIVGWDGAALRLLALEILTWQAASGHDAALGARLTTRIAATGDRTRLRLERDAAASRGNLTARRESWTDLLAWHAGAALADAPQRPPLAGTWQQRLAVARSDMIAFLAHPCDAATEDVLALCGPPDLTLPT